MKKYVRTILLAPDGTGFYVSSKSWHDPRYSYDQTICNHYIPNSCNCRMLALQDRDWLWIGQRNWYGQYHGTQVEAIRQFMAAHHVYGCSCEYEHGGWYQGEFIELSTPDELDLTISVEEHNEQIVFASIWRRTEKFYRYVDRETYYATLHTEPVFHTAETMPISKRNRQKINK